MKNLPLLVLALALAGCATSPQREINFGSISPKAPSAEFVRVYFDGSLEVLSVDGKPLKGDRKEVLALPPGQHTLNVRYAYSSTMTVGNQIITTTTFDKVSRDVSFDGAPGSAWLVSYTVAPSLLDGKKASLAAGAYDPSSGPLLTPPQSYEIRQVHEVTGQFVRTSRPLHLYSAAMVPFWFDSTTFAFAGGGELSLEGPTKATPIKKVKISSSDLVIAFDRGAEGVWFLDKAGKATLLNRETLTAGAPSPVLAVPTSAQASTFRVAVQVGNDKLVWVDPKNNSVQPWISTKEPIRAWSLASDNEDVAVLTKENLSVFDSKGSLISNRKLERGDAESVKSLGLAPDGSILAVGGTAGLAFLQQNDWEGSPKALKWLMGHGAMQLSGAQGFVWRGTKRLYVLQGSRGSEGLRFWALDVSPGNPAGATVSTLRSGASVEFLKTGYTFDLVGGNLSADGEKIGLLGVGGPLGTSIAFVSMAVDLTTEP